MTILLKIFFKLRKLLTISKVWIQRSMSYIAIINSAMILFLLLSKLEDYGFEIDIKQWFFPMLIGGIIVMIIIGYMDDKLGFHREESRAINERNPQLSEILKKLNKIEKTIKKK